MEAVAGGDFPEAGDVAVRLPDGVDIGEDEVVGAEEHALAIGGGEEVGAFFIGGAPLAAAGDEAERAVSPQGGDVVLRERIAGALFLLRIVGGDVDDLWRFGEAHAAVSAATDQHEGESEGEEPSGEGNRAHGRAKRGEVATARKEDARDFPALLLAKEWRSV